MGHDISSQHPPQPDTLDTKVKQALAVGNLFESWSLREARAMNGDYYQCDPKTGHKVISCKDILVEDRGDTVAVVFIKPGANTDGVVSELSGYSQKAIGAVIGETQQSVSDRVLDMAKSK